MSDIKIRPIKDDGQLQFVMTEAREDEQQMCAPTHAITAMGELRGAMNIVPMVLLWLHTQRNGARSCKDSLAIVENMLANNGNAFMCIPCKKDSPFYEYMERLGYVKAENYTLFMKGLQ